MIRLRAAVVRGLRHRWLGPALALLLAVLLALLVLHSALDEAPASDVVVCVAIALLVVSRFVAPPLGSRQKTRPTSLRAPPLELVAVRAPAQSRHSSPPLRL
jgi:hypothetical protein